MTTYNTGNPIGSTEVKDLYDNAENLDIAINSPSADVWADRLGQPRKTWRGIENDAQLDIAQAVAGGTAQAEAYRDESLVARDDARAAASASGPIAFYGTYAAAQAAASGLPAGGIVEVSQDETRAGARTRYKVQAGALVFVVNLDQTKLDLAAATGASLVGYLPAGTGAVATTAQDKLREFVSVKDYGAKGDGVTDDTSSFQAALDYIKTLPTGARLYVPPGVYALSAPLTYDATKSLHLLGDGGTASTLYFTPAVTTFGIIIGSAVDYRNATILLEGLHFGDPGNLGMTAVLARNCVPEIYRCEFSAMTVALNLDNTFSFTVEKCRFSNTRSEAIFCGSAADAHNGRIVANGFFGCGTANNAAAIRAVQSDNIDISGNQVEGCYIFLKLDRCSAVSIESNYSEYCTLKQFDFVNSNRAITIEKNWLALSPTSPISNVTTGTFAFNSVFDQVFTAGAGLTNLEIGPNTLSGSSAVFESTWITPTLFSSWVNNGGNWEVAGYRKDSTGRVHLRGLLTGGASGTTIFMLGEGYRPAKQQTFAACGTSGVNTITVFPYGAVQMTTAAGGQGGLGGVSFTPA